MAKRRNKNKAKKRLAAIVKSKDMGVLCEEKVAKQDQDTENSENLENGDAKDENFGLTESDGFTEKDIPFCEVTENVENIGDVKSKGRGRKQISKNVENGVDTAQKESAAEGEETFIFPREIAGETCLDVECGSNDAILYLTKLCLGSKGACILHDDKWYTPNEFQSVSGRETAKDWKRSIRHKGKSLKLLISKGLIDVQTTSPKKSTKKPESSKPTENSTVSGDDASDGTASDDGILGGKATSPDVKSDMSEGPFKKVGKGRRGKKPKKQLKLKQNVALVRPLSIQKPVEEIQTEDLIYDKCFVEKPVADIIEEKKNDVICDVISQNQAELNGDYLLPMVNYKKEPSIENMSEKEEVKEVEMDTRTDEERRLDEFVKSLRLTKTVNATNGTTKAAPELTAVEDKKPEVLPDEPIDTEMPVLQKEPILEPTVHKIETVTPSVDPLQATVTPPPTPPSENPIIRKVIEEDQEVETFKSRLSSPSNGLKLTINREKVKALSESGEPVDDSDVTPVVNPQKDQNMQAFLLQDALQSARKYKEQLQQNKQQISSAATSLSSKPVASVNSIVSLPPSQSPGLTKYSYELAKPAIVNGAPKSLMNNSMSKSQVPSKSGQGQFEVHLRPSSDHRSEKSRNIPGYHQSKTPQPTSNSGMPSVNDVMAMMPQLYGSLPFPLESQESALAALQAFHLKDKLSPFNASQAAAQANLLHPVITQQLLMAMTQQLLHSSMYSIPQPQQQSQQSQHHRSKSNGGDKYHLLNSKSKEIRHHNSEGRPEKTIDMAYKKRKHSEISKNAEGVLDLSVKKPKLESVSASGLNKSQTTTDAPIDFSLKRKSETTEHKHTVCYKPHSGHSSVRSSFPSDYRYTQPSKNDDKRFPVPGCTCRTGSAMDDISTWSVDRVCSFLTCLDGCAAYAKTFRDQGITGRLLPYLTTQHLTRTLGMKVGPALTLMHAVERKFREQMTKQTCALCRNHQSRTVQI